MTAADIEEAFTLYKKTDPDTPLRLKDAARIGFPGGGMTVTGLRAEAKRGRLLIWRIAAKDYTSLGEIRKMLERCRIEPGPASAHEQRRPAVDEGKIALEHALETIRRLKEGSPVPPRTRRGSHDPATARRR